MKKNYVILILLGAFGLGSQVRQGLIRGSGGLPATCEEGETYSKRTPPKGYYYCDGGIWVLLSSAQATVAPYPEIDFTTAKPGETAFSTSQQPVPGTPIIVFRDGQLQRPILNFTRSGNTITFTVAADLQPGTTIALHYWRQP